MRRKRSTMESRQSVAFTSDRCNRLRLSLIPWILATIHGFVAVDGARVTSASQSGWLREGRRHRVRRETISLEYYNLFAASSKSLSGLLPKESSKAPKASPKSKKTKGPSYSKSAQSRVPSGKGSGKGSSSKASVAPATAAPSTTSIPTAQNLNPPASPAATTIPVSSNAPSPKGPSTTASPSNASPIILPPAVPTLVPSLLSAPSPKGMPPFAKLPTLSPQPSRSPKTKSTKKTALPTVSSHPSQLPMAKASKAPSSKTKGPKKTKGQSKSLPYKSKAPSSKSPPHKTKAPSKKSSKASMRPSSIGTASPSITFAPSDFPSLVPFNDTQIDLAPYSIGYSIDLTWIPSIVEVEDVVVLTRGYLDSTFRSAYEDALVRLDTAAAGDKLFLNAPYQINYTSSAIFNSGASTPTTTELDALLQSAFSGDIAQSYVALLQELGPDNIFSTTSEIVFMSFPSQPPATVAPLFESQEDSSFESSSGLSASLVATVVCAASVALVVLLGLAHRHQKLNVARRTTIEEPAPEEFGAQVKELQMDETQSLVLDEADVTSTAVCAPGFDRAMLLAPPTIPAFDANSRLSQDPLEPICPSRETSDNESPFAFDTRPLVPTDTVRYRCSDETESYHGVRRRQRDNQSIVAEIVSADGARHLAQSESEEEDENVPLRVIDLIRFFTPPRQLEPPGNRRGGG